MSRDDRPEIEPTETSKPYWEAALNEDLLLRHCDECTNWIFYPREWCPHCWSTDLSWKEASGYGEIHTYTVIHQAVVSGYENDTPYVLAIIRLEEGPQMMANVVNCEPKAVEIGSPVQVTFERRSEWAIPQFELH